jgi:hypothetical protein
VLDPPSPKSQLHEVGDPLEVSVNWTVSGAMPDVGVPVKEATRAEDAELTVIYSSSVEISLPAAFMAVMETV